MTNLELFNPPARRGGKAREPERPHQSNKSEKVEKGGRGIEIRGCRLQCTPSSIPTQSAHFHSSSSHFPLFLGLKGSANWVECLGSPGYREGHTVACGGLRIVFTHTPLRRGRSPWSSELAPGRRCPWGGGTAIPVRASSHPQPSGISLLCLGKLPS